MVRQFSCFARKEHNVTGAVSPLVRQRHAANTNVPGAGLIGVCIGAVDLSDGGQNGASALQSLERAVCITCMDAVSTSAMESRAV